MNFWVTIKTSIMINNSSSIKTLNYTDWDKFGKLLVEEGWNNLNLTTVDEAFDSFIVKYNNLKNRCIGTRQIKLSKNENKKELRGSLTKRFNSVCSKMNCMKS